MGVFRPLGDTKASGWSRRMDDKKPDKIGAGGGAAVATAAAGSLKEQKQKQKLVQWYQRFDNPNRQQSASV